MVWVYNHDIKAWVYNRAPLFRILDQMYKSLRSYIKIHLRISISKIVGQTCRHLMCLALIQIDYVIILWNFRIYFQMSLILIFIIFIQVFGRQMMRLLLTKISSLNGSVCLSVTPNRFFRFRHWMSNKSIEITDHWRLSYERLSWDTSLELPLVVIPIIINHNLFHNWLSSSLTP